MLRVEVSTIVRASPETCFDLARDLDLHQHSLAHTGERAVAGRTSGLIELGEEVTWRGCHFGVVHEHTARITAFDRPRHFQDEMTRGRFKAFVHDHYFEATPGGTNMRDVLVFACPFGVVGRWVGGWILQPYLKKLLEHRGRVAKEEAESLGQSGRS